MKMKTGLLWAHLAATYASGASSKPLHRTLQAPASFPVHPVDDGPSKSGVGVVTLPRLVGLTHCHRLNSVDSLVSVTLQLAPPQRQLIIHASLFLARTSPVAER